MFRSTRVSSGGRRLARRSRSHPGWLRRSALAATALFIWTLLLATPIATLASLPILAPSGVRHLSPAEMQHLVGQAIPRPFAVRYLSLTEMQHLVGRGNGHGLSYPAASGPVYPWEGSYGDVNTGNGDKLTSIPLVSWTQRGGLPVVVALYHNSESARDAELGQKWSFSYDIYLVASGTGPHYNQSIHWGNDLSYQFTNNGSDVFTPPTGIHDTFVKNVDGTFTLTTPDQTAYHFTTTGYCNTITDENGNTITLGRNSSNNVTSITDATGRAVTVGYDTSNRINLITDPLGRQWSIAYDTSNELQTLTYPVVSLSGTPTTYTATFGYDSTHDITNYKTPNGNHWTYNYNTDYSLNWEQDPAGNQTVFTYVTGNTTIADPNGHTLIDYYTSGLLTQETDALTHSAYYQYDSSYDRTQVTDLRGYVWKYTFDGNGNELTAQDPYSNTITCTYNAHNKLLTRQDALGHTVTWTYNGYDNLLSVTDALSHATTYTVDTYGERLTSTDALSHETQYGYDGNGNLNSVTDPNTNETTLVLDALGQPTSVTDALGHTVSNTYDAWERAISVTNPAGTTTTVYDGDNNTVSVTDPNSHTDTFAFDGDDRLITKQKANGDTINYYYDGSQPGGGTVTGQKGLLSAQKDGNGHVISWTYDALNRKLSASYPDSTSESWTYDNASNILSHTNGKSQVISYAYDNADKLITVTYPSGTGAGSGISYTYDAANRKTGMTDVSGTWGYTFDNADRLTQISAPNGTTGYGYDNANRRTSMTLTQGSAVSTWSYTFDNGSRLLTTTNPYSEVTTNTFDAANRLTGVINGNGTLSSYVYDNANRITEVTHTQAGGTPVLGQYAYTYDGANNVLTRADNDGSTTTFGYDPSDQLTSEVRTGTSAYSISYTYDHNSNRKTKVLNGTTDTYTYDSHDKLQSTSSKSYTYDLDGNCTSVTVGGQTTTLSYDIENRVIGISYPGGATNSFVYNGEDLRTQKVDSAGTKNYVCDGDTPASAVLTDSAAVYTPGLSERRSGVSKFTHGDAMGSTRGITDRSSPPVVTDSLLYDGFGMTVSRTGTTPTPFCFVGKEQYQSDSDSGLQLLGHRYYDPSIGRFLSQDPIQDGDNWYAYCDNNPLKGIDPEGLEDGTTTRRVPPKPHKPPVYTLPEVPRNFLPTKPGPLLPPMPPIDPAPFPPPASGIPKGGWPHHKSPPQGGQEPFFPAPPSPSRFYPAPGPLWPSHVPTIGFGGGWSGGIWIKSGPGETAVGVQVGIPVNLP